MLKTRVIPVLLLRGWGIEKSIQFREFVYVGSPINAARVFSGRNVDELVLLDIEATREGRTCHTEIIAQIAEETTMPLSVGGGIRTVDDARKLLEAGADRVVINSALFERPELLREGAERFGRQCMLASIDYRRHPDGRCEVFSNGGRQATGREPLAWAEELVELGAGEILLTSIDRDGTMVGYDLELTRRVADALPVPVIACGGAGSVADLAAGVREGHATAVAAGAFFLFYGRRRTVLITYPTDQELAQHLPDELIRQKIYSPPPHQR
ncbi:MAG: HisA/HisF-related TIM barrel protein [Pirellulales bacterium]